MSKVTNIANPKLFTFLCVRVLVPLIFTQIFVLFDFLRWREEFQTKEITAITSGFQD